MDKSSVAAKVQKENQKNAKGKICNVLWYY